METPNAPKQRPIFWIPLENAASVLCLHPETVSDLARAGFLRTTEISGDQLFDLMSLNMFAVVAQWEMMNG